MKIISFGLSFFSLLTGCCMLNTVFAAAPDPSSYPYEQQITLPSHAVGKQTQVILSQNAVNTVKPDLSNLQLVDGDNNPVDFRAFTGKSGKYLRGTLIIDNVSSRKEGSNPIHISDNDPLTAYEFDEKVDGREPSTVTFMFPKPVPVNRIVVYPDLNLPTIRTFQIEAGMDPKDLKTVKARDSLTQETDFFDPVVAQYFRISFWGSQVRIWDINFYVSPEVEVYFTPEQASGYRLLFGNPDIKSIRYIERLQKPFPFKATSSVGKKSLNPLLTPDIDGDGISNGADNCLFVKNKDQADSDRDSVGDVCDNAPENQNYSQIDTDRDSIGDIVDNCKLKQNIDQKDRDKDGLGDVCDDADGNKFELTNKTKPYFFYGLLILLILGVVALLVHEKFFKRDDSEKEE